MSNKGRGLHHIISYTVMKILVTGGSGLVGKYVVDDLLKHNHNVGVMDLADPAADVEFHRVDVLDLEAVSRAMRGYEVVIHMAGIPHPLNNTAKEVFHLNVNGTFNVLESAAHNNVAKVILTSSESTLGFAFMEHRMVPDYFPIDEFHPLRPQDPYGLSKVVAEQMCRTYSARYGFRTVCLREPWIWVPESAPIDFYKDLVRNYKPWHKNLWTYVHVYDVATAHRLAVETDLFELHEAMFITGAKNWTERSAASLIGEYYPEVTSIAESMSLPAPLIEHAKATRLLGYRPLYTWRDLFTL
jgi:UDP-glucose 4-epimerase